jgi:hypothetical protein
MLAAPALARPESSPGSSAIVGTVTHELSGQPLADVVVTALSPVLQEEQSVLTDARGFYVINGLPPGVYTLLFEREASAPNSRTDLSLPPRRALLVNVTLRPASMSVCMEFVEVPPLLDLSSTPPGATVDEEFLRSIAEVHPAKAQAEPPPERGDGSEPSGVPPGAPGAPADDDGVWFVDGVFPVDPALGVSDYVVDGVSTDDPAFGLIEGAAQDVAAPEPTAPPGEAQGTTEVPEAPEAEAPQLPEQ